MRKVLAFSMFCEDVRHEKAGQRTLVGVLGDSVSVPQMPGLFPKLAVFSRVSIPIDQNVEAISQSFVAPNGDEIGRNDVDPALLEKSKREAIENGSPVYGVTSDMRLAMFGVENPGVYSVSINVDGEKVTTFLNVKLTDADTE